MVAMIRMQLALDSTKETEITGTIGEEIEAIGVGAIGSMERAGTTELLVTFTEVDTDQTAGKGSEIRFTFSRKYLNQPSEMSMKNDCLIPPPLMMTVTIARKEIETKAPLQLPRAQMADKRRKGDISVATRTKKSCGS
jgi:hypothetical protein